MKEKEIFSFSLKLCEYEIKRPMLYMQVLCFTNPISPPSSKSASATYLVLRKDSHQDRGPDTVVTAVSTKIKGTTRHTVLDVHVVVFSVAQHPPKHFFLCWSFPVFNLLPLLSPFAGK